MSASRECAFEGCGLATGRLRRGLCRPHYEQQRKGLPLTAEPRKWRQGAKRDAVCAFDGCDKPVQSVGLCSGHYDQRQRGVELQPLRVLRSRGLLCEFEGCGRSCAAAGLCSGHYAQRRSGRPLTALRELRDPTCRDGGGRKQCRGCDVWQPEDMFTRSQGYSDGRTPYCARCVRDAYLQRQYSITIGQYDSMLAAQGGVCAICAEPDPTGKELAVDHDHACCPDPAKSCGKCVRGLLCWPCNVGIGHLRDDPKILTAAAEYLAA